MKEGWDWETKNKVIANINEWKEKYIDVRELTPSPDGEKIAGIVQPETRKFTLCVNGETWEDLFDRMYSLRFNLENQPICLVYSDYQWTVAIGDKGETRWENTFDMMWNLTLSADTKSIAVNVRTPEMTQGVCLNDQPWENFFVEVRDVILSPDGQRAATRVQINPRRELDIFWFYEKNYTIAVDGEAWANSFMAIYGGVFSDDGNHVAACIMTDLAKYTVVVDGKPWDKEFSGCWEPIFVPGSSDVIAPVQTPQGWTLAKNGNPIWPYFIQVWKQRFSSDGKKLVAVVAVDVGKWTVAVDGNPWKNTFNQLVADPVFSPDGKRIAVAFKHKDKWGIAVDDKVWEETFDIAWDPVFSPTGERVAARVEKDGKYYIVVDGKIGKEAYEWVWDPVFSPDGSKLLVRCIKDGKYCRKIFSVNEI